MKLRSFGESVKLDKSVLCRYHGKTLELNVCDMQMGFNEDPYGTLVVKFADSEVFRASIAKGKNEGGSPHYRLGTFEVLEFVFKNGPWMHELAYIASEIQKNEQSERAKSIAAKTRSQASKIDL